ncbi:MAG: prenyltransferase/squalene oxidase repeat-containing protein [Planctomycetota bacterium]
MLKTAKKAKNLLGDSAEPVKRFLLSRMNTDGGFRGRSPASDLYYTAFASEALLALDTPLPVDKTAEYLDRFAVKDLDLVHLACLVRCRANLGRNQPAETLAALEKFRSDDHGFNTFPKAKHTSAYACFLALAAYQDLNERVPDADAIIDAIHTLRTPVNAYSNDTAVPAGSTPATAAAIVVLHYLNCPVEKASIKWLWDGFTAGGFTAIPRIHMPDLLSTATALHAMNLAGASFDNIRQPCLDFLNSLRTAQGAFCANQADNTPDCEYTYYGLLALGNLSDK